MNKLNESEVESIKAFAGSQQIILIEVIEHAFDISNDLNATIKQLEFDIDKLKNKLT